MGGVFGILGYVFEWLLSLLPGSFVQDIISNYSSEISVITDVVGYINFFIPLNIFSDILSVWLPSMLVIFVYFVIKNRI